MVLPLVPVTKIQRQPPDSFASKSASMVCATFPGKLLPSRPASVSIFLVIRPQNIAVLLFNSILFPLGQLSLNGVTAGL